MDEHHKTWVLFEKPLNHPEDEADQCLLLLTASKMHGALLPRPLHALVTWCLDTGAYFTLT